MKSVEIVEVGPRDGLQNEARTLKVEDRVAFVRHLAGAGLKRIEVGAFVAPGWVPQMQQSDQVIDQLLRGRQTAGVRYSALTPNERGIDDALKTAIPEVAIFGAASESFSRRNTNCSIEEGLRRFGVVTERAKKTGRRVRGYLSVAFGCPFEGPVSPNRVLQLVKAYFALGMYEISIGDTIGVATPLQVQKLLRRLKGEVPFKKLALHFHDTRGTALANVLAGYHMGVRVFDSSFGGLGGCPYANGASGNLATDDLVYMLQGMGIQTGVDLPRLLNYAPTMRRLIGRDLPSRTSAAGVPRLHTLKL